MRTTLVIFDCDGVLVDSERLVVEVEARILSELGWPMGAEEVVARWMGRSSRAQLAEVEARLGAEAAARFDELSTAESHRAFEESLLPVDGAEEVVAQLQDRGVGTCVASSGTHARIRRTLGLTGLWAIFEGRIFSASDVANGKPEPDLFLHAASQKGASPGSCLVVEDSAYGVEAAVRAGMPVLGYAGGLTPRETLVAAGAEPIDDLHEVLDRVRRSPRRPSPRRARSPRTA